MKGTCYTPGVWRTEATLALVLAALWACPRAGADAGKPAAPGTQPEGTKLCASGEATSPNIELARTAAVGRARTELVRMLALEAGGPDRALDGFTIVLERSDVRDVTQDVSGTTRAVVCIERPVREGR